jgi:hypothetical protein
VLSCVLRAPVFVWTVSVYARAALSTAHLARGYPTGYSRGASALLRVRMRMFVRVRARVHVFVYVCMSVSARAHAYK